MYWDVKVVRPLPDFRIYIEIEDGRKGIFDMTPYLDHGVFRELRDVHYFNQVGVVFGAVTWPNEQDIAPETLLSEWCPVLDGAAVPPTQGSAALGCAMTGKTSGQTLQGLARHETL